MEPKVVLLIKNHYILIFDMIFFMQQLNPGLENCKMIYHFCDVLINKLPLKASRLFQISIIFSQMEFVFIRLKEHYWKLNLQLLVVLQLQHTKKVKCLHYFQNYVHMISLNFLCVTTLGLQTTFFINGEKSLTLNLFIY